ncbi:hypothetical protein ACOMHN_066958 [Nucella lapillus]
MGNRTNLYVLCVVLFPVGFAAFVVGFGCPVWQATSTTNTGLWQSCKTVFIDCFRLDFDKGEDWMIGVRVVEIFALVMYVAAAIDIMYENTCSNFNGRPISERIATGVVCILAGLGGLSGIIVYAVKTDSLPTDFSYGWAMALLAASSALAVILGIGFIVSGCFFEKKKKHEHAKGQINGRAPHLTSNDENYELSAYASRNAGYDAPSGLTPGGAVNDNLPGFAVYNGMLSQPGQRNSLPIGVTASSGYQPPPPYLNGRGRALPPTQQKSHQYYSVSDDRILDPNFDLSEGFSYLPARSKTTERVPRDSQYRTGVQGEDPYSRVVRGREEDPYSRGGKGGGAVEDPYNRGVAHDEDPYNRVHRPPRAGYNDPYGFDRPPNDARGPGSISDSVYDRANFGRSGVTQPSRDGYYRPGMY